MGLRHEQQPEQFIRDAEVRIGEHKAHLQRLIVRGQATQSADDILAAMYVELRKLQKLRSERKHVRSAGRG